MWVVSTSSLSIQFKVRLIGRRVILFIDNDSARHALVKTNSPSPAVLGMVLSITVCSMGCFPWYSRVTPKSNPADLPSRKLTEQAAKMFGIRYLGVLAIDQQTVDLVCNNTTAGFFFTQEARHFFIGVIQRVESGGAGLWALQSIAFQWQSFSICSFNNPAHSHRYCLAFAPW